MREQPSGDAQRQVGCGVHGDPVGDRNDRRNKLAENVRIHVGCREDDLSETRNRRVPPFEGECMQRGEESFAPHAVGEDVDTPHVDPRCERIEKSRQMRDGPLRVDQVCGIGPPAPQRRPAIEDQHTFEPDVVKLNLSIPVQGHRYTLMSEYGLQELGVHAETLAQRSKGLSESVRMDAL